MTKPRAVISAVDVCFLNSEPSFWVFFKILISFFTCFSTSFFWRTFPRLVFLFILLIWFCCFGFTFRLVLFLLYFLLLCNLGHYSWIFFGLHIRISVFVLFAFLFVLLFVLLYSLLPFISLLLFNWIMLFLILVLFLFLQFILFF